MFLLFPGSICCKFPPPVNDNWTEVTVLCASFNSLKLEHKTSLFRSHPYAPRQATGAGADSYGGGFFAAGGFFLHAIIRRCWTGHQVCLLPYVSLCLCVPPVNPSVTWISYVYIFVSTSECSARPFFALPATKSISTLPRILVALFAPRPDSMRARPDICVSEYTARGKRWKPVPFWPHRHPRLREM